MNQADVGTMDSEPTDLWQLAGEGLTVLVRGAPGFMAFLSRSASLVLSGEPVPELNYGFITAHPEAAQTLSEFVGLIARRQSPTMVLLTKQASRLLSEEANRIGLKYAGEIPFMTCEPSECPTPVAGFQISRIHEETELEQANQIIAGAFSISPEFIRRAFAPGLLEGPGATLFLVKHDGKPVSTVMTTQAGTHVGIWAMATDPGFLRRGAARAVLHHVLSYHFEHGAKRFFLIASEQGKPLYKSVGFRTAALAAAWIAGDREEELLHRNVE